MEVVDPRVHDECAASDLWNQRLAAWTPMFTPVYFISLCVVPQDPTRSSVAGSAYRLTPCVHCSLAIIGVAFIIVGALVSSASADVVEQVLQYDSLPECKSALQRSPCVSSSESPANPLCWRELNESQKAAVQNQCQINIKVEKAMAGPVYFYYEL